MRFVGICILALSVLALPSYAAATCQTTCGVAASVGDDCCGSRGGESDAQQRHHEKAPDSKMCVVCANSIAIATSGDTRLAAPQPLIDVVLATSPSNHAEPQDAIFHPPRA